MAREDSLSSSDIVAVPGAYSVEVKTPIILNKNARGIHVTLDVTQNQVSQSEVQQLVVDATGGTYTLLFNGQETPPLSFDADAAAVESALRGLSTIQGTNVAVTPSGQNKQIAFQGALANQDVSQIGTNPSQLTGNSHSATVSTTQQGSAGSNLTVKILEIDQASGKGTSLLTSAGITTISTTTFKVYPGLTAVNNLVANDVLPRLFAIKVTPLVQGVPTTFSCGYHLIP